jgi:hypothetical protein
MAARDPRVGNFDSAFAPRRCHRRQLHHPDESHAMMEPHATIAAWEGEKLTVWTSNQMIAWGKGSLAKTLGIKPENVRLDLPFIGGGFGGSCLSARMWCWRPWRQGGAKAGEDRAAPAFHDEQHHPPPRHHPAREARRTRDGG